MGIRLHSRAESELDALLEAFESISPRLAQRFEDAVLESLDLLHTFPELGSPCEFESPKASDIRFSAIKRFRNYFIFYRPIEQGIDVLHFLRGSRDVERIVSNNP